MKICYNNENNFGTQVQLEKNVPKTKKMELVVPNYFCPPVKMDLIWGKLLLNYLAQSDLFRIQYHDFSPIYCLKGHNFTPFYCQNKLCFIDEWDYSHPTSQINDQFFRDNPDYQNLSIVFKIQYCRSDEPFYAQLKKKYGIQVLPFFMFPSYYIEPSSFLWQNTKHPYLALYSGRVWRHRAKWEDYMGQREDCIRVIETPGASQINHHSKMVSKDDYLECLKLVKWGLILSGKGCGSKNRREPEYTSLGMPLALNYEPVYPFPFVKNVHYVKLEKPEDLEKLKNIDPMPYHQKSVELYRNYFSPEGMAKSFVRLFGSLFA